MRELSREESDDVLSSDEFENLAVGAFDDDEMLSGVYALGGNLVFSLLWLFSEGNPWEHHKAFLESRADDRDRVLTNPGLRSLYVDLIGDDEMAELVDLVGGTLGNKLEWMQAEGASWPQLAAKIDAAPSDERLAVIDRRDIQAVFVEACDDPQMAEAADKLGGTVVQKFGWVLAEGSNYGILANWVAAAPLADRMKLYESGEATAAAIEACGDDDMKLLVDKIGGSAIMKVAWLRAEGVFDYVPEDGEMLPPPPPTVYTKPVLFGAERVEGAGTGRVFVSVTAPGHNRADVAQYLYGSPDAVGARGSPGAHPSRNRHPSTRGQTVHRGGCRRLRDRLEGRHHRPLARGGERGGIAHRGRPPAPIPVQCGGSVVRADRDPDAGHAARLGEAPRRRVRRHQDAVGRLARRPQLPPGGHQQRGPLDQRFPGRSRPPQRRVCRLRDRRCPARGTTRFRRHCTPTLSPPDRRLSAALSSTSSKRRATTQSPRSRGRPTSAAPSRVPKPRSPRCRSCATSRSPSPPGSRRAVVAPLAFGAVIAAGGGTLLAGGAAIVAGAGVGAGLKGTLEGGSAIGGELVSKAITPGEQQFDWDYVGQRTAHGLKTGAGEGALGRRQLLPGRVSRFACFGQAFAATTRGRAAIGAISGGSTEFALATGKELVAPGEGGFSFGNVALRTVVGAGGGAVTGLVKIDGLYRVKPNGSVSFVPWRGQPVTPEWMIASPWQFVQPRAAFPRVAAR